MRYLHIFTTNITKYLFRYVVAHILVWYNVNVLKKYIWKLENKGRNKREEPSEALFLCKQNIYKLEIVSLSHIDFSEKRILNMV